MVEHGLPWRVRCELERLLDKIDALDVSDEEKHRLRLVWMQVRDDVKRIENMESE